VPNRKSDRKCVTSIIIIFNRCRVKLNGICPNKQDDKIGVGSNEGSSLHLKKKKIVVRGERTR